MAAAKRGASPRREGRYDFVSQADLAPGRSATDRSATVVIPKIRRSDVQALRSAEQTHGNRVARRTATVVRAGSPKVHVEKGCSSPEEPGRISSPPRRLVAPKKSLLVLSLATLIQQFAEPLRSRRLPPRLRRGPPIGAGHAANVAVEWQAALLNLARASDGARRTRLRAPARRPRHPFRDKAVA
jgi:hypothetical protein